MAKIVEKLWTFFSVWLMLVVLFVLPFSPTITRYISLTAILLGLWVSIFFIAQCHRRVQQAGKITPAFMRRAIALDITGLLLTMGVVILVAGKAGAYVAQLTGTAWGMTAGILAAIAAGIVVGVVAGLLVRWGWQRVTGPWLAKAARASI